MKSNRTFLFIFLLPVFMVALLSMSINLISIYKLKQQFEFNIKTQTQDLMVVEEAANLSSDLATLQKRISNTLELAESGELDEGMIYAQHSEFVEEFALLEPRIVHLSKSKNVLKVAREDAINLLIHFNAYRNFIIMASDIVAIDPAVASAYISDSLAQFVSFAEITHRITARLSQQVSISSLNGLERFESVFKGVLVIMLLGLIIMLVLSSMAGKRLAKKTSLLSDALSLLSDTKNVPPELPDIEAMSKKEHGEFYHIAKAVLTFREAILQRISAESKLIDQSLFLQDMVDEQTVDLLRAKSEAEAANVAKSAFLANMSHEIRTPLNAIVGFTHILRQKTDMDRGEQKIKLKKISDSSQHLLTVINDILDFSKIEAGKLSLENTDFKIERVLDNVFSLIGEKAQEKELEVIFDVGSDIPDVLKGDPVRLGQVLLNFISNAVKFTEKGSIKLRVRSKHETDNHIELLFEVVDHGIGLTDVQQSRLFNAFEQADDSTTRKFGGTGLGLVISKRIAKLMKGEVGVISSYGEGSTFWFSAQFSKVRSPHAIQLHPDALKNQRVLVVDDVEDVLEVHRMLLENMNIRVDTALSGALAIKMAEEAIEKNDPYNIILMDWSMPEMDGFETTRQLRCLPGLSSSAHILVTAFSQSLQESSNHELDVFDAVLTKPISASILHDTLLNVINHTQIPEFNEQSILPNWKRSHCSILLVEDNKINQEVVCELLELVGLEVVIAENGKLAIEKLEQNRPDLVLMDLQMPVMDGIEATKIIRAQDNYDDLPIIAMTANAFSEDKAMCLNIGMNEHLAKPIDPENLYDLLRQWLPEPEDLVPVNADEQTTLYDTYLDRLKLKHDIDVDAALKYLKGNKEKYTRELFRYRMDHADIITALLNSLDKGEVKEAIRAVHTLKGTSAILGFAAVRSSASLLEQLFKDYDKHNKIITAEDFKEPIQALDDKQSAIIDILHQVLPSERFELSGHSDVSEEQIKPILIKLKDLLQNDDYQSAEFFTRSIADLHAYFGDKIHSLEKHVSNYDFEEAVEALELLKNERQKGASGSNL